MVFTGEIESIGKDVRLFEVGDKVYSINHFGFVTYA